MLEIGKGLNFLPMAIGMLNLNNWLDALVIQYSFTN